MKLKKYKILFSAVLLLTCFSAGCADIKVPTTKKILEEPLGEPTAKIGMTKNQILAIYDEPDIVSVVTSKEWSGSREEWLYRGRYPSLPVGAGYLREDLYLYFDGENLTHISKKPLGSEFKSPAAEKEDDTIK